MPAPPLTRTASTPMKSRGGARRAGRPPTALITPPLPPGNYVDRPRLREKLEEAVPKGVAMIVAPAGFGKTVALADFVRHAQFPIAWLTCTSADADLGTFVESLVAALRRHIPSISSRIAQLAKQSTDRAVPLVAGELARVIAGHAGPVGMVLDDFHAADGSRAVAGTIAGLLEQAPGNLFLAIASRSLPAMPYGRLLTAGRLLSVEADELRFTSDEVATYLGADPQSELAIRLFDRTAGWAAALHLTGAEGSQRALDDYLESEVFLQQRAEVRRFLLRASVAPVITPDLCRTVFDDARGGDYLDEAQSAGLFVMKLPEGGWRLHDLFRDFLRARLHREDVDLWEHLHREVASTLRPVDAIPLLSEAGLSDDVGDLIGRHAQSLVNQGRWGSLRGWLSALPARVLRHRPRLTTLRARTLAFGADPSEALALFDEAAQLCASAGDTIGEAEAVAYRAARLGASGRMPEVAIDLRRARGLLAGREHRVNATLLRIEGVVASRTGDLIRACEILQAGLEAAQHHRDRTEEASCERNLAWARSARGDVGPAISHYERASRLFEEIGDLDGAAEMCVALGAVHQKNGDVEHARRSYDEALRRAAVLGHRRVRAYAIENLALLDLEAGAAERAISRLTEALDLARAIDDSQLIATCLEELSRSYRAKGDAAAALTKSDEARAEASRSSAAQQQVAAAASKAAALLADQRPTAALAEAQAALSGPEVTAYAATARARIVATCAAHVLGLESWRAEALAAARSIEQLQNRAFLAVEIRVLGERLNAMRDEPSIAWLLDEAKRAVPAVEPSAPPAKRSVLFARLLGRPIVTLDGRSPDGSYGWQLAPTRELFYLLEAHRGGLTPDVVIDRLFPDAKPGAGPNLFWQYSHQLRASLRTDGEPIIVKRQARWQLSGSITLETDVERFEAAVRAAQVAMPGSDEEGQALTEALALYRGHYLVGVEAEWVKARRRRLRELRQLVARRAAERYVSEGRLAEAATVTRLT